MTFILNKTDKPVSATVTLEHPLLKSDTGYADKLKLRYIDTVFTTGKLSPEKVNKALNYTVKNDTTLVITIPPNSTTYILQGHLEGINRIEVNGDGINQQYRAYDVKTFKHLKKYGFPAAGRKWIYSIE